MYVRFPVDIRELQFSYIASLNFVIECKMRILREQWKNYFNVNVVYETSYVQLQKTISKSK